MSHPAQVFRGGPLVQPQNQSRDPAVAEVVVPRAVEEEYLRGDILVLERSKQFPHFVFRIDTAQKKGAS